MWRSLLFFLFFLFIGLSCGPQHTIKNIVPLRSFLKIEKYLQVTVCNPQNEKQCLSRKFGATASGVIVAKGSGGIYALTAGHVCNDGNAKNILKKHKHTMHFYVISREKEYFPVEIVAVDTKNDLCMLYVKNLERNPVRIAHSSPVPGDRIYNTAAPMGIFDKNMIPMFDGFYNGTVEKIGRSIYSLPAKGGSSGSPIVNYKGELVGIISAVFIRFPNLVLSPNYEELTNFIKITIEQDRKKREINNFLSFLTKAFCKK
jgi:S1-C subfamily serine protease